MELSIVLVLNTIAAIIYLALVKSPKQRVFSLFFILLPVLGFAIYYLPVLFFKITQKHNLYDESNLRLNIRQENFAQRPDVLEEINEVAFSEVSSIAKSKEKRSLLMGVLRNNLIQSRDLIQTALDDNDSETSHYAASASLEINRRLKTKIQDHETRADQNPDDLFLTRDLIDAIDDFLELSLITPRERLFYSHKAINLYRKIAEKDPSLLKESDYIHWSKDLLYIKSPHESLKIARRGNELFKSEDTYLNLLDLLYQTRHKEDFEALIKEFKQANFVFSSKGLELIRFWNERSF